MHIIIIYLFITVLPLLKKTKENQDVKQVWRSLYRKRKSLILEEKL